MLLALQSGAPGRLVFRDPSIHPSIPSNPTKADHGRPRQSQVQVYQGERRWLKVHENIRGVSYISDAVFWITLTAHLSTFVRVLSKRTSIIYLDIQGVSKKTLFFEIGTPSGPKTIHRVGDINTTTIIIIWMINTLLNLLLLLLLLSFVSHEWWGNL